MDNRVLVGQAADLHVADGNRRRGVGFNRPTGRSVGVVKHQLRTVALGQFDRCLVFLPENRNRFGREIGLPRCLDGNERNLGEVEWRQSCFLDDDDPIGVAWS